MKLTLIILLACTFSEFTSSAQQVRSFTLNDLSNQQRSFDDLKGEKLTIIDFWATWCKPCNKAIPALNKIYDEYKNKGVAVIGINCDGPRSIAKVAPLSKTLNIQYPVLIDMNIQLMAELNLSVYPTLIIVNNSGKIVWIHEGFVPGDEVVIAQAIDKQLSKL